MLDKDRQQSLLCELIEAVSTQAPPGWSSMDLLFIAAGRSLRCEIELDIDAPPPSYPHAAVLALREAMYESGRGTWFTMSLTLTAAGAVTTAFDYETRPPGPSLGTDLEEDLRLYPRDTIPDWMADALAELADPATKAVRHADEDAPAPLPTFRHDINSPRFQAALHAFEPEEPGMVYFKLSRTKPSGTEPVVVFIEVDADGYENRRVEIFSDGSADNAGFGFDGERTRLLLNPVLPLEETVDSEQFGFDAITPMDFQAEWLALEGLD